MTACVNLWTLGGTMDLDIKAFAVACALLSGTGLLYRGYLYNRLSGPKGSV